MLKYRYVGVLFLFLFLVPVGCVTTAYHPGPKHGGKVAPPDHAKAYGYRAKHRYRYHPEASVYFDLDRKLYFYLDSGRWLTTANLPSGIELHGEGVSLSIETERPYEYYSDHRKKYPPGKSKKKKKKKKSHWKEDDDD